MIVTLNILVYIQRKVYFRATIFLYSPCHYMRAWIRVLDAPGCYEQAALQGSGLVKTVGPCAQRRVALMPRAIATARDALSNDRRDSKAPRVLKGLDRKLRKMEENPMSDSWEGFTSPNP